MKTFLVKLSIRSGEYEKTSNTLVTAPFEWLAKDFAMALEAHDPETMRWSSSEVSEMGCEFVYSVYSITEVAPSEVPVLSTYFKLWEFDLDTLMLAGDWSEQLSDEEKTDAFSDEALLDPKPDPIPPTYTAKFAEFGNELNDVTSALIVKEGFATDSEAYRWIFETWVRNKVETEYAYQFLKFINNTEITHFNTVDAPDDINEAASEYCGKLTDRQVADVCDWYFTDQLPRDGMQFVYDVEEVLVSDQE